MRLFSTPDGASDSSITIMTDWKDLLVAQGHDLDTIEKTYPLLRYREPMMLLRNTGKKFVDVSAISGKFSTTPGWAAAWRSATSITTGASMPSSRPTAARPISCATKQRPHNHWITLRLIGHKSNRDAIGAQVKVTTALGDQWGTVTTSSGYLSSSDPQAALRSGRRESGQQHRDSLAQRNPASHSQCFRR